MRNFLIFCLLLFVKYLTRLLYRVEMVWIGEVPPDPWRNIRLVAVLNHTSLFEPVFAGGVPNHFLWRIARHGLIPAADKTLRRPLLGQFFRLLGRHVVPISRERDASWEDFLRRLRDDSMVIIFPEGRMRRANGLDNYGKPMTVRGGIADILQAMPSGKMVMGYSLGLHHIQVPGQRLPRLFRTARMRLEALEISEYRQELVRRAGEDQFKWAVIDDMARRRDQYCFPSEDQSGEPAVLPGLSD